ncbi:MAG TPA: NAD(P)H-dependent oxidoreductase [Solirubrobacteraceae bacterium]
MKLLGVSGGAEGGSAEILLKAALMAASELGATVSWLSLDDMRISTGPTLEPADDDCRWFFDQVMDADGVIYASPIYSRTSAGKLRLLTDRVFGPHADVGFIQLLMERERAGTPVPVPFKPDERALRPRVAAFLVTGGALGEQWNTLALPLMHSLSFSLRCGVVDQAVFSGSGTPASVVLQPWALDRARLLGERIAEQLGRPFEDVEYLGEPGLCPLCHLNVIDVREDDVVECATCGAEGQLLADESGGVSIVFDDPAGLAKSVISMQEKRLHSEEILSTAAAHAARADEIAAGAAPFRSWDGGRVRP